jgi:hypothetical protein
MKYFNFRTKDLDDGTVVPYWKGISYSDTPIEDIPNKIYSIDTEKYTSYFYIDDGKKYTLLFEGFCNYPKYKFDLQKHIGGVDPFVPYGYNTSDHFVHQIRRDKLSTEISYLLRNPTELKYHRKTIDFLLSILTTLVTRLGYDDLLNEIINNIDVNGFNNLNETINTIISKYPKSEEYFNTQVTPEIYTGVAE